MPVPARVALAGYLLRVAVTPRALNGTLLVDPPARQPQGSQIDRAEGGCEDQRERPQVGAVVKRKQAET